MNEAQRKNIYFIILLEIINTIFLIIIKINKKKYSGSKFHHKLSTTDSSGCATRNPPPKQSQHDHSPPGDRLNHPWLGGEIKTQLTTEKTETTDERTHAWMNTLLLILLSMVIFGRFPSGSQSCGLVVRIYPT